MNARMKYEANMFMTSKIYKVYHCCRWTSHKCNCSYANDIEANIFQHMVNRKLVNGCEASRDIKTFLALIWR